MNILIVQESDWIERNPHQQHHLMERLSLKDHNVRVIDYEIDWKTNKTGGMFSSRKNFKNINKIHEGAKIDVIRPFMLKIPVFNYFSWSLSNWVEINRQIDEFKPDIIIGFGLINTYIASRAAKKRDIPFVYYLIDVLYALIPEKTLQAIGKKIKKRIIKNSDLVITINKRLAEFAIEMGSDVEKTEVIGAGIDLKEFDPTITGLDIKKKYKISEKDLVLFFMGWIYHFAGVKEVAEELGKVNNEYKNLKLMVVGDGDAFSDLEYIKEKYNLHNRLILTGKQPYVKIPEFIAAADICILPAYPDEEIMQDIVPIKIYEYMAMGKPVVATSLPGIMKEFETGNGLIYANSPENVIEKSIKLDKENLGIIAREFVEEMDWETITVLFEKKIEEVIHGN